MTRPTPERLAECLDAVAAEETSALFHRHSITTKLPIGMTVDLAAEVHALRAEREEYRREWEAATERAAGAPHVSAEERAHAFEEQARLTRERDEARAQVAALREATASYWKAYMAPDDAAYRTAADAFTAVLADTAAAAAAHDARVRDAERARCVAEVRAHGDRYRSNTHQHALVRQAECHDAADALARGGK